jgi:glycosyltransferase involved in cell wall biosynthesis
MHIIARLNIGGAALYVIELIERLNASGYAGELVCGVVGANEGDMQYVADQKGVTVTVIPSLGREISPVSDLKTLFELWQIIRHERPDIVHTHTAKAGFVGRIAARLAGVPVILHFFNGHVFSGYFSPAKTRAFILLEQFCALLSTRIITVSEGQKRELSAVYHITRADHIDVIETGFQLDSLAAIQRHEGDFRAQFDIPPAVPLIGIVGRLVPIKNHDLFLSAAQIVHQQNPDAYFVLVGDGERRAELEAAAEKLGLKDRLRITGWIADMRPVYSALDVLVLSSLNEGLPVCLIEAMAARVPVVATAVGGIPDLVAQGELGMLTPLNDPAGMANAMLKALRVSPAELETIKARALDRFSMARSLDRTLELYSRLLKKAERSEAF